MNISDAWLADAHRWIRTRQFNTFGQHAPQLLAYSPGPLSAEPYSSNVSTPQEAANSYSSSTYNLPIHNTWTQPPPFAPPSPFLTPSSSSLTPHTRPIGIQSNQNRSLQATASSLHGRGTSTGRFADLDAPENRHLFDGLPGHRVPVRPFRISHLFPLILIARCSSMHLPIPL